MQSFRRLPGKCNIFDPFHKRSSVVMHLYERKGREEKMSREDDIRIRDQRRLQGMIALNGPAVASKENRILLQFIQAEDICRLLSGAIDIHADHASTALLRFGIDTLATGFWMAFVAPSEYFVGQGNIHIPSDLARVVATLPPTPKDMLTGRSPGALL